MANAETMKRKIATIDDAVRSPINYKGGDDPREVIKYVDKIYAKLRHTIYNGSKEGENGGLLTVKTTVMRSYRNHREELLEDLRAGKIYDDLLMALMQERLEGELGQTFSKKALGLNHVKIKVVKDSPAIAGVEHIFLGKEDRDPIEETIFFNPRGVVLLDKDMKDAAMSYSVAHLALGHLKKGVRRPEDHRDLEFDAHDLGRRIYGRPEEYNNYLRFLSDYNKLRPALEAHPVRKPSYLEYDTERRVKGMLRVVHHHLEYSALGNPTPEEIMQELDRRDRQGEEKRTRLGALKERFGRKDTHLQQRMREIQEGRDKSKIVNIEERRRGKGKEPGGGGRERE